MDAARHLDLRFLIALGIGILLDPPEDWLPFVGMAFLTSELGVLVVLAILLIRKCLLASGYAVNGAHPKEMLDARFIDQEIDMMLDMRPPEDA